MIDVFSEHGEDVEPGGGFRGNSKQNEKNGAGDEGVYGYLNRMFVEGGQ